MPVLPPRLKMMSNAPSFFRDFALNKTLNHGFGPNITFTRTGTATYFDSAGVLTTATANTPRFDHDPSTLASRGLLIEDGRTNSIRNSQAGGSTNGVIGSGGALPTNWSNFKSAGDLEVIGSGTENGLAYVDVRFYGTNSTGGDAGMFVSGDGLTQIVATSGQTWTSTMYIKLQSGSLSGVTTFMRVVERDATSLQLAVTSTQFTATSSFERVSTTRTLNNVSTTRVTGQVSVVFANNTTIDFTLRIAAPQLELGAFATSYIPTTNAAVTRGADSAIVTPISSFYNQAEGTLFAEYSGAQVGGSGRIIFNISDNTVDNRIFLQSTNPNAVPRAQAFVASNTEFGSTIGAAPLLSDVIRFGAAFQNNNFIAARSGTLGSQDTSGLMPSNLTHAHIGQFGTAHINGHIRKVGYWPKRLSNAQLQAMTG